MNIYSFVPRQTQRLLAYVPICDFLQGSKSKILIKIFKNYEFIAIIKFNFKNTFFSTFNFPCVFFTLYFRALRNLFSNFLLFQIFFCWTLAGWLSRVFFWHVSSQLSSTFKFFSTNLTNMFPLISLVFPWFEINDILDFFEFFLESQK